MKTTPANNSSRFACLCGSALLLASSAGAQTITPLLEEGDTVAGVGAVTAINNLDVNSAGDWFVEADTDHPDTDADSVLYKSGSLYLREGGPLAAPPQATINSFDAVRMDNSGNGGFNFFLENTTGTSDDSGVFFNSTLMLQESTVTTLPAFTTGTTYIGFFETWPNDTNQILVVATMNDPATATTRALVILSHDGSGGAVTEALVYKEGDTLPGQTETVADFGTSPHNTAFNNAGQVLFFADQTGATATDGVIYLDGTLLAQEGSPSPLAGRNWRSLSGPELDLNNNGDWVFSVLLDGDTASDAILVKNGAKFRQEGDTPPGGVNPLYTLTSFGTGPVCIADTGQVLWYGDWNDVDTDIDTGLFLDDLLLVQEGVTQIGGVLVDTISSGQDSRALSDDGSYVVFEATLQDGTNGAYLIQLGSSGTPFCFGDGSDGVLCPCGNAPAAGVDGGCLNSLVVGAVLSASGSPSVSSDTLSLTVSQAIPNEFGIFVQNIATGGPSPFYDGAICLALDSHLVRHYSPPSVQPTLTNGVGSGVNAQPMTQGGFLGDTQPGVTLYYQFWHRDNQGPCGTGANFSRGLSIVWEL